MRDTPVHSPFHFLFFRVSLSVFFVPVLSFCPVCPPHCVHPHPLTLSSLSLSSLSMCPSHWAGNAAVVKPSELSKHSASLLKELLPQYLDQVHILVFLLPCNLCFMVAFILVLCFVVPVPVTFDTTPLILLLVSSILRSICF